MKIQKILLFIICLGLSFIYNSAFAAINFTLTPLKYEINADPGETVTRVAQIRNNGTGSVTLSTASSDFQANGTTGVPNFVRKSELVYADQELSSWITIDTPSVTLAPGETKGFTFDVDIPLNATPGGHYAAVFFKNPNSESSGGAEIGINVDYGILLLVNVSGEIVVDIDIDDVVIGNGSSGGGGGGGGSSNVGQDNCPLGDLTSSNFDGKCIDNPFSNDDEEDEGDSTPGDPENNTPSNPIDPNTGHPANYTPEDFEITFQLPINNNGNTHVKPEGKIKLIDEDGQEIKGVGKEIKKNDYGAVIGEEIVDYLPINDEGGNVLPKTKRNFETTWKGFPYKTWDKRGNPVIQYWKPGEYYTNRNLADNRFMMPWERMCEKRKTKLVQAIIEVSYDDKDGEQIQYNSADEFEIVYTEQYIGINPYIIIPLILFILFWLTWWLIIAKKKVPCVNDDCDERLGRNDKKCNECGTKQKEKKAIAVGAKKKKTGKKKKLDSKKLSKKKLSSKKKKK